MRKTRHERGNQIQHHLQKHAHHKPSVQQPLAAQLAQGKIAGCPVEIRPEAPPAPDGTLLGKDAGKGLDHQIFRIIQVAQVAVEIEHQRIGMSLHQCLGSGLVPGEIPPAVFFILHHQIRLPRSHLCLFYRKNTLFAG